MSVDKKILLSETAHVEGSPAVRETDDDEKSPVLVIPSTPRNGTNRPKNILAQLSKEDLLSDVRTFATQKGLEEYLPDLEKGALLAQRPDDFHEIVELTDEDRVAIQYEKDHKWSHPLWLWLTIIICSTGEFPVFAMRSRLLPFGAQGILVALLDLGWQISLVAEASPSYHHRSMAFQPLNSRKSH